MCDYLDLAVHLIQSYKSNRVARSRLIKSIYLCDWKSCLADGHQMTSAEWTLEDCGPYSPEIAKRIEERDDLFRIERKIVGYETVKYVSLVSDNPVANSLTVRDLEIINFVINRMNLDSYSHLNAVVNSTFPAYFCAIGETIDMVKLAQRYSNQLSERDRRLVLQTEIDEGKLAS